MARNPYSAGRDNFARGRMTGMSSARTLEALREMGEHVANAAKSALKDGADIIVADAKNRCPVKTGRLRNSIKATANRNGTVYQITANASKTGAYGTYYYGGRVEFDPRYGHPFLYPAMDAHRREVYDKVRDAISDAIRRGH